REAQRAVGAVESDRRGPRRGQARRGAAGARRPGSGRHRHRDRRRAVASALRPRIPRSDRRRRLREAGHHRHPGRPLQGRGADGLQLDEPTFNVYMDDVRTWGIDALHRAIEGLTCKTAVHICYGYGIKANVDWKATLGGEWRQYEQTFPALAASRIDQVSVECANSHVPVSLLGLLRGKDVLVGVIDVATDAIETPAQVAATIRSVLPFVPPERLYPCTNCG